MKRIAVITGASSGMGRRFAETCSEMGPFDEVWVMARSRDRLEALKGTVPYMPTGSHILNLAWRDAKRNRDRSRFGAVARLQGLLAKLLPHSFVMSYWMKQQKLQ